MARGAVVVIFSDGWERGDAELLASRCERLRRLAHRVVWVNPHRGKAGYQPVQRGIVAALPHVDDFVAGHSLAAFEELWRWSPMREVLAELLRWWRAGETVGVGTVVATGVRAAPAGRLDAGRARRRGGRLGLAAAASRARSTSWPRRSSPTARRSCSVTASATSDAFAVGLTCGGILDVFVEKVVDADLPRARGDRRRHRGRAAGRGGDGHRAPRPGVGRRRLVRAPRDRGWRARSALERARRRRGRRRARPAGARAHAVAHLRPRGRAPRRGHAGLRLVVRSRRPRMLVFGAIDFAAAVARLGVPRLPGDGVRRPAGVRDRRPVPRRPTRWSSSGRTSTSQSEVEAGRIDARTVICVLTHDPKFDVPVLEVALRLPETVGLRRRDGLAEDPRRPARRGCARPG